MLDDIWLTKGCPQNISIVQQPLECYGDVRISRFGSPSAQGYDGVHMRGGLAVQSYTGSMVNILLDNLPNFEKSSKSPINITPSHPTTYADSVKRSNFGQQYKPNRRQPNHYFAQPKFVPSYAQNTGSDTQQYSVHTQNRFSAFQSGN